MVDRIELNQLRHRSNLLKVMGLALGLSTLIAVSGCSGSSSDPALDEAAPPPAAGAVPAAPPSAEKAKNRPQGNAAGQ